MVNDEARKSLPTDLSHCIALTIYESKGLEFDDVLLFNFFKYSEVRVTQTGDCFLTLRILSRHLNNVWYHLVKTAHLPETLISSNLVEVRSDRYKLKFL